MHNSNTPPTMTSTTHTSTNIFYTHQISHHTLTFNHPSSVPPMHGSQSSGLEHAYSKKPVGGLSNQMRNSTIVIGDVAQRTSPITIYASQTVSHALAYNSSLLLLVAMLHRQ
jgi:hypothetical protein